MSNLVESIRKMFVPIAPLPPGIYHFQALPTAPVPYRLHLRLEPDGSGLLIINASTILHLNQTAAELAYYLIMQTPENQAAEEMHHRFHVSQAQALTDYQLLKDRIDLLIHSPDLDPESNLEFERTVPNSQKISAPFRLDCALTYRLPGISDETISPTKRVDRELSTQEWTSIFDKAWNFGIPHIILTGGEPTLREDLADLIAHTEANGQVVGLLSDGIKLVDTGYLDKLLQTGLDHLMLTLKPEDDQSWKALENVLAVDLSVAVHHTLTYNNVMDTIQVLDRLSKMGVKAISLSASHPNLNTSLAQFRDRAASMGLSLVWDLPVPYSALNPVALETQLDHPPSGAGHAWLYIEPDGDVLPSQEINQVLGNILKDPWETLWH